MTTKEEISALNQEIDNILTDCQPDKLKAISSQLEFASENAKTKLSEINTNLLTTPIESNSALIKSASETFTDLHDLVKMTKTIANHLYDQLVTMDVTDPNLVEATAEFIRSTRESIADFIQIYRDEQAFLHKIQLSMLQFSQKKDLLKYKAELTANKDPKPVNAEVIAYSQEQAMDLLNNKQ